MTPRAKHLVVVGTSAGGLEALRALVAALPATFPAPICVVMHTSPQSPGVLPEILQRSGSLTASNARNAERLLPGHIYVAPPDCHLVVEPGSVRVTKGPKENRFRPAVDPLFRSAAQVFGPAAIGVILTGNLDDGAAGLWAIKRLGGIAVVQDPADAMFPSMPLHALARVDADHVVPIAELAPLLMRLTTAEPRDPGEIAVPDDMNVEINIAKEYDPRLAGLERIAQPSQFACPECHGVLLKLQDGDHRRFRCHTGHAYSVESLLAAVSEGIDEALWNAIRALTEAGLLLEQVAGHLRIHHHPGADPHDIEARIKEARAHAEVLRKMTAERTQLTTSSAK